MTERPLGNYSLAESFDVDFVHSTISSRLCAFRLSLLRKNRGLDAHFRGLRLGHGGIYYLEYGADAQIDLSDIDAIYVALALSGQTLVSVGPESFVNSTDCGCVIQPGQQVSLRMSPTTRHLVLRLDESAMRHVLRGKIDREPKKPIRFRPQLSLIEPGNRTLQRLLAVLVDTLDSPNAVPVTPTKEFTGLLASQLILGQPNNYYEEVHRSVRPVAPQSIRQAAEMMESRAHESLSVDHVACVVGIGVRALRDGFRRVYNTTPTAFLRELRLQRAREDLLQADPLRATVTIVAFRWGFQHLGRFSVMYHRRFGETPSQTLRNRSDCSL